MKKKIKNNVWSVNSFACVGYHLFFINIISTRIFKVDSDMKLKRRNEHIGKKGLKYYIPFSLNSLRKQNTSSPCQDLIN